MVLSDKKITLPAVLAGLVLALAGCYTVVSHPETSPRERVTDDGRVLAPMECGGCHTDAQLWSFHRNPYYIPPSHHSSLSGYYAYRYDHLFIGSSWYRPHYYNRWANYYYRPWWYGWPHRHPHRGGVRPPEEPAVGRGERRDGYDSQYSRDEFTPFLGPGSGPLRFSSPGQPPIYIQPDDASARPVDSGADNGEDTSARREPSSTRPRYDTSPPPPPPPPPAQPRTTQQGEQPSDDDDESGRGGRGGRR